MGLIKLTWKVEKFMRANVARKKSEISKAIVSNLAGKNSVDILIKYVKKKLTLGFSDIV